MRHLTYIACPLSSGGVKLEAALSQRPLLSFQLLLLVFHLRINLVMLSSISKDCCMIYA